MLTFLASPEMSFILSSVILSCPIWAIYFSLQKRSSQEPIDLGIMPKAGGSLFNRKPKKAKPKVNDDHRAYQIEQGEV